MKQYDGVQVGLIGAGIQASRSPHLHESEARALGFPLSYHLLDLDQHGVAALPQVLASVQEQGFAGVNITHPCKQAVLPLLDEWSPDAVAIGAVNTVVFTDGKRIGHNTDCYGFAESFRRGLPDVERHTVVLLGAGGAGSAVARAALQLGVTKLLLHEVDSTRATALCKRLQQQFERSCVAVAPDLADAMAEAEGLIQATPIGMRQHPGVPLPLELLRPAQWVAELIYFPLETALLKQARALGCRTLEGSGMAVFQAAEAFRLFTGKAPDHTRMLRSFTSFI